MTDLSDAENNGTAETIETAETADSQPSELDILSDWIIQELGEAPGPPQTQIRQITVLYGPEFVQWLLEEVRRVEEAGGILTQDGSRRRTPGGVYLLLAKQYAETDEQRAIFKNKREKKAWLRIKRRTPKGTVPNPPGTKPKPIYDWEALREDVGEVFNERGISERMKLTLIGRPGKIKERRDMVIATIDYTPPSRLTFPRGVPTPPKIPTTFVVYMGAKQWRKNSNVLEHPDDALIIEGICVFDPQLGVNTIFAQSVSTRRIQQKVKTQRAKEKAAAKAAKAEAQAAAEEQDSSEQVTLSPAEAAKRLSELRRAEAEARDRLDEIKELPAEEQVGMSQVLRELQTIKDEIRSLRQQFPTL
jgi:flagellar biosynthesis GTPase FlhF